MSDRFGKMDKIHYRAVIKHFYLKAWTPTQIKNELDLVYAESAPSYTTVKNWVNEFKWGRTSLSDEQRPGRPKTATTEEKVRQVHEMVLVNRRSKASEIAEALGISKDRVLFILHEDLHMKKINVKWVPHALNADQKLTRVLFSEHNLSKLSQNPTDFWRRFVTADETWVHHYIPEAPQALREWTASGERPSGQVKRTKSSGKVFATVFWDMHGILLIDYLPPKSTSTGEYYAGLLDRLKEVISTQRPGLKKKKVLFHHDNASPHRSHVVMSKLDEVSFEIVQHPAYSPDLAPCDYYLFTNLKKHLSGKVFSTNEEVVYAVNAYFGSMNAAFYSRGIQMLKDRWTRCVQLKGDYVE